MMTHIYLFIKNSVIMQSEQNGHRKREQNTISIKRQTVTDC